MSLTAERYRTLIRIGDGPALIWCSGATLSEVVPDHHARRARTWPDCVFTVQTRTYAQDSGWSDWEDVALPLQAYGPLIGPEGLGQIDMEGPRARVLTASLNERVRRYLADRPGRSFTASDLVVHFAEAEERLTGVLRRLCALGLVAGTEVTPSRHRRYQAVQVPRDRTSWRDE